MSDNESSKYIRVWQKLDTNTIKKQLLLVDDLYGTCASCNHLGLNYLKDKSCPTCKTVFAYIATKDKNIETTAKILARMEKENISLVMIERDDYSRTTKQDAVKSLFKEI